MNACRTFTMEEQRCFHFDSVNWPNKAAARERRDCVPFGFNGHGRGVGEPQR